MTDIKFFFVKRAGRHFGFLKRAGRHQKGAGRRALQKRPRQNTVAYMTGTVNTNHPSSAVPFFLLASSKRRNRAWRNRACLYIIMLEHYFGKLHNHCLQEYSQITVHN